MGGSNSVPVPSNASTYSSRNRHVEYERREVERESRKFAKDLGSALSWPLMVVETIPGVGDVISLIRAVEMQKRYDRNPLRRSDEDYKNLCMEWGMLGFSILTSFVGPGLKAAGRLVAPQKMLRLSKAIKRITGKITKVVSGISEGIELIGKGVADKVGMTAAKRFIGNKLKNVADAAMRSSEDLYMKFKHGFTFKDLERMTDGEMMEKMDLLLRSNKPADWKRANRIMDVVGDAHDFADEAMQSTWDSITFETKFKRAILDKDLNKATYLLEQANEMPSSMLNDMKATMSPAELADMTPEELTQRLKQNLTNVLDDLTSIRTLMEVSDDSIPEIGAALAKTQGDSWGSFPGLRYMAKDTYVDAGTMWQRSKRFMKLVDNGAKSFMDSFEQFTDNFNLLQNKFDDGLDYVNRKADKLIVNQCNTAIERATGLPSYLRNMDDVDDLYDQLGNIGTSLDNIPSSDLATVIENSKTLKNEYSTAVDVLKKDPRYTEWKDSLDSIESEEFEKYTLQKSLGELQDGEIPISPNDTVDIIGDKERLNAINGHRGEPSVASRRQTHQDLYHGESVADKGRFDRYSVLRSEGIENPGAHDAARAAAQNIQSKMRPSVSRSQISDATSTHAEKIQASMRSNSGRGSIQALPSIDESTKDILSGYNTRCVNDALEQRPFVNWTDAKRNAPQWLHIGSVPDIHPKDLKKQYNVLITGYSMDVDHLDDILTKTNPAVGYEIFADIRRIDPESSESLGVIAEKMKPKVLADIKKRQELFELSDGSREFKRKLQQKYSDVAQWKSTLGTDELAEIESLEALGIQNAFVFRDMSNALGELQDLTKLNPKLHRSMQGSYVGASLMSEGRLSGDIVERMENAMSDLVKEGNSIRSTLETDEILLGFMDKSEIASTVDIATNSEGIKALSALDFDIKKSVEHTEAIQYRRHGLLEPLEPRMNRLDPSSSQYTELLLMLMGFAAPPDGPSKTGNPPTSPARPRATPKILL